MIYLKSLISFCCPRRHEYRDCSGTTWAWNEQQKIKSKTYDKIAVSSLYYSTPSLWVPCLKFHWEIILMCCNQLSVMFRIRPAGPLTTMKIKRSTLFVQSCPLVAEHWWSWIFSCQRSEQCTAQVYASCCESGQQTWKGWHRQFSE